MLCPECREEIENFPICPYCGNKNELLNENNTEKDVNGSSEEKVAAATKPQINTSSDTGHSKDTAPHKKLTQAQKTKRLLLINGIICVSLLGFISYTIVTAVHWVKVDIPEHKETFHTEQRATGAYRVSMDDINPCYVGQNWNECINAYINEYNNACANRNLSNRARAQNQGAIIPAATLDEITNRFIYGSSASLCSRYSEMIEEMQQEAQNFGPNRYVSSLGSWGHLHVEKEFETVTVSNNDYQPAVTHEAVCYLGIFGECDYPIDMDK